MKNVNMNELVKSYTEGLETLGVEITKKDVNEDGDVVICFKDGNGKFITRFQGSDPGYVSIIFPNFYPIESEEEYVNALMASAAVTRMIKAAKVLCTEEGKQVSIAVEFYDFTIDKKAELLRRYIGAMENAVVNFLKEINERSDKS